MGYRIEYGQQIIRKQISNRTKKRGKTAAVVTVAMLTIGILGAKFNPEVLLPGDKAVTAMALQTLVEDLKTGERFADAVTTFCITIVENGSGYE